MRRPRLLRELGIRHCVVERGNHHAGVWLGGEDLDGLAVATGTACASGSQEPSPALVAMNLPKPVIQSAIRFSFGRTTHASDLMTASEKIYRILQKSSPVHPNHHT